MNRARTGWWIAGAIGIAAVIAAAPADAQRRRRDRDRAAESTPGAEAETQTRAETEAETATETETETVAAPSGTVRDLVFSRDLGQRGDLNLEGIRATREVAFGVPARMRLVADPTLTMTITRSGDLLPEISSLTIRVDGRPVATVPLDMPPNVPTERTVTLPLAARDGYHNVTIVAYHRSQVPCEIDEHPGLWSRISASSYVRLTYAPRAPRLDLARWPRPFADDRDPDPEPIVIALPADASADAIRAAGYVAASVAHELRWRALPIQVHVGDPAGAPPGHLIAFTRDTPVGGGLGTLELQPRPGDPMHAMLVVRGRDDVALASLGQMLASEPTTRMPAGTVQRVSSWTAPRPLAVRSWRGWAPQRRNFTLADLGWRDTTVQGYRGGSVWIPLRVIPDERVGAGGAQVELHYSYGPRADADQARMHVLVDGVAVDGVRLTHPDGETRARMTINLPAHLVRPSSTMEVRFLLPPERGPECTDSYPPNPFGTVHSTTRVTLDRNRAPVPADLALLRHGGFPFGLHPDYAATTFVLPAQPTPEDLQRFVWVAAELGRVAPAGRFAFDVDLGTRAIQRQEEANRDLVIVDRDGAIVRALGLERVLRVGAQRGGGTSVAIARGGRVVVGPSGEVATFEMAKLPWDEERSVLVVSGGDRRLFELAGRCGDHDDVVARLDGRAARVAACDAVVAIAPVHDPSARDEDRATGAAAFVRDHYWWLLALVFGIVLLVIAARLIASARRRRYSPVPEPAE